MTRYVRLAFLDVSCPLGSTNVHKGESPRWPRCSALRERGERHVVNGLSADPCIGDAHLGVIEGARVEPFDELLWCFQPVGVFDDPLDLLPVDVAVEADSNPAGGA